MGRSFKGNEGLRDCGPFGHHVAGGCGSHRDIQEIFKDIKAETEMIKKDGLDWMLKASPQNEGISTDRGKDDDDKD